MTRGLPGCMRALPICMSCMLVCPECVCVCPGCQPRVLRHLLQRGCQPITSSLPACHTVRCCLPGHHAAAYPAHAFYHLLQSGWRPRTSACGSRRRRRARCRRALPRSWSGRGRTRRASRWAPLGLVLLFKHTACWSAEGLIVGGTARRGWGGGGRARGAGVEEAEPEGLGWRRQNQRGWKVIPL